MAEYVNSPSRDRPIFFDDNEDHSVQYKEYLENSSNEIDASNSNQEKKKPPQDSDIRQLIREECCIEVCEEQRQNMENTILELVKIYQQKELYCMHDNVDDLIKSALNSKLLSINLSSQRKEKQEVKNVMEQPTERRTRIIESLQNFRVIHKSSISLKNTSQISLVHTIAPILSTEELEYSLSIGYEHPNTILKTKSDEIINSGVEELVPILNENEVTSEDKRDDDDAFEDIEYVEASLPDPEIVSLEEENDVYQEEGEFDLEEIQDVVLREKLLSINRLIANIESLNDNLTPDCRSTEETRSSITTTHAHDSLPEYDSFCFEIEPDQKRLTSAVMNDISDDSSIDPLLEEVDLFLASDNSIPPGIENIGYDLEGDIRFFEELLIDDSILFPNNEASDFDNPSFLRPPPEPPDAEFDFEPDAGEEISVVMNTIDELECLDPRDEIDVSTNNEDDDSFPFMFVIRIFLPYLIYSEVFTFLLSAESEDTIFDPEKEKPPQDSDIRQLIREECCIKVCEEQRQIMENTILELVKICQQKKLYCMHDNVDDHIESALNSKLLSINLNSQRHDKKKQEVKNVVEQPAERKTRIVKSLQNFKVIHKSSISLKNTSQISPVHAVAPILSTKEPEYSLSMGYKHLNTTPETESDEIIKSVVEELVQILSENEVTSEDKREENCCVTSDQLALIAEKTKVSKSKENVVVSSDSKGSEADDFSELKKINALLAKAFNQRKFYSKPTNNNLRTSSTSQSANKKQEFVKTDNKKDDEKKRDMSRVKCYNCKKEGHFAKDCKKFKVKEYEYYKTKMLLAKKDKDEQVLLAKDQAWMESSKTSSSSADDKISKVSYYLSESESESEYETSEYYDNTTTYGLFVNDNDQEIFHDYENFPENLIESQINHNESAVNHNDSEGIDKLIRKFNKLIAKCLKRIEKANQQNKDFEYQNKDLQDKYDVLKNQATTFEMNNKELNEQLKVLIEKNDDLLAQTEELKDQLQVKHVVIDTHVECQEKYAKLEAERYEYTIRYSTYFDNDKQHRKHIADQEVFHSKLNKDVKRYSRKDLLSCNNSHLGETSSAYVCNDAMNVSYNSRLCDSFDENNLFIFDDESVRISPVSKMPFRKKPRDSMNVCSKNCPICLWIIDSGCSKHMTGNRALLTNFMETFLGMVCFRNNDFAVIAGYVDVVIRSMSIKKVYYIEGLGHNLFSLGQFCDKGLEVAFRSSTSFVRNEDGVDLLTGDRSSNLYTIAINEVASNSSTCLLAKASSSQSWLWHQCLSHLNFATINNLVKNNLVQGLPKMKFDKDYLCSACEQGKIHRKHHKSKTDFASNKPLYLLHMDLCGPMHVESINGKQYVLVVVDDYSRYTCVFFLHSKDEASELKAKGDIRVFVGYSKESAAFRIYNNQTRKIHLSVNVNFDEISEMASKQFSLEHGLSNLKETGKSSNPSISQVSETSKKDLEDLF
nr:ribonuclease H-like domain-containing protein [Tanacetum cinerariifolium]